MLNFSTAATLAGPRVGPTFTRNDDDDFLANLPYPPLGSNAGHRIWTADRGFLIPNPTTGLAEWRDRISGEVLAGVAGTSLPTKTEAWTDSLGRAVPTYTFSGLTELDTPTAQLDTLRNTVYLLMRLETTDATLNSVFGPAASPVAGAPTDDVLALATSSGVPRLVTDAGTASLLIGSGDRRNTVALYRLTMSPEYGKAIHVNGVQNARNAALTTGLTETRYSIGNFGSISNGFRLKASVQALIVLAGQDHSDPYFADADARITSIYKAKGNIA